MKPLEAKRMLASKAGKASALKRKSNGCSTGAQRMFNECSTSKVKESKVNNSAPAPLPELPEEDDDEGMDPMEALRLWREMEKNKE